MTKLCVYIDPKAGLCGKDQEHKFHKCLAVGLSEHSHPSRSYCHPYTPPAETGRRCVFPVNGQPCGHYEIFWVHDDASKSSVHYHPFKRRNDDR